MPENQMLTPWTAVSEAYRQGSCEPSCRPRHTSGRRRV